MGWDTTTACNLSNLIIPMNREDKAYVAVQKNNDLCGHPRYTFTSFSPVFYHSKVFGTLNHNEKTKISNKSPIMKIDQVA
jgi:hypothetical protein